MIIARKLPQHEYKVYATNKQTCIWCFWNSNKKLNKKSLCGATLLNYFTPIGTSILGTALCNLSWSLYCWIAVGGGNFCSIFADFEQALSEIIFLFLLLLLVQGINHRPFDPLNFKWLSGKRRHFCFSLYFQFWNIQNFKWSQI